MLLGPFSRANQPFFFRVPTPENDRALRFPARLQQLADAVYRLQHRRRSAVRVHRTIDPRVSMITRDHPLIGQLRSPHSANHVPDGAELIVLFETHSHFHRPRTHVIGER